METTKFYQLLGQITYSFGRIDFLISNISVDIGLTKSYQEFFARTNFANKIKLLKDAPNKVIVDNDIRLELINQLDILEELRTARNSWTHSIILENVSNRDELLLYNYINNGDKIKTQIVHYSSNDIEKLNDDFIKLYNDIYVTWERLKQST